MNNAIKRLSVPTLLLLATSASAQLNKTYQCESGSLSPSQSRFNTSNTNISTKAYDLKKSHPTYHAMLNSVSTAKSDSDTIVGVEDRLCHNEKNIVLTGYSAGKEEGDFIPYEGRSSYDWRLYGHGNHNFGEYGTLYGSVQYAKGKHRGISWNAMRSPELYWPYAITDSTGGDCQFESYSIEGGYGINLNKIWLGVVAQFDGEQAHRMTDPRILDNTTFLQLGVDAAYVSPNGQKLMLLCKYLRNKEYENDRYWRPGEQQRFFVLYGFGLYDTKESSVSFGRSRMFYINGLTSQLSYASPQKNRLKCDFNLGYSFKKLNVEESDYMDLFASKTIEIEPELLLTYDCSNSWRIQLFTQNSLQNRLGYERVFEKYMTNVATSTYDYRQIAEYQNYKFKQYQGTNALKSEWNIAKRHSVGIQGGVNYFWRNEENVFYDFKDENLNITPYARIDYKLNSQKHELSFGFQIGHQKPVRHTYDVDIKTNSIEHLDFQTCFAPYAYYAASFTQANATISYIYHFKKFGVGTDISFMNISGKRLSDVEYDKTIGYNSVCPMISTTRDKHDEKWFNTSLYVVF